MKDLLMVVPSRGRPAAMEGLCAAMRNTCELNTQLVVGLDEDDVSRSHYPDGPWYEVRAGLRQVNAWINALSVPRAWEYRAIGHFGDDNLPQTPGWDAQVMAALEKTPFAFANDLYPREPGSLPCHVFMRAPIVTALGYMGPPSIRHMVDLAWLEWGRACGITFLSEVIIEHLHWSNGKSEMDDTYRAVNECLETDHAAFAVYRERQLAADVKTILAAT